MDQGRVTVPWELFDWWSVALCELALGNEKYYYPYKDRSTLLIKDNDGSVEIRETECPHCNRLFCAQCRLPWHDGIRCKELRKRGDDEKGEVDLMLRKLADRKKWQSCPNCKMYVSRVEGCLLMQCRSSSRWKERHLCLAMHAAFVMFLGISFSIAQWKARRLPLAMSAVFVMFLDISFSIAQ